MINNNKLIASIILGALIIASALVITKENKIDEDQFDKLLETYQERQEAKLLQKDEVRSVLKIKENDRILGNKDAEITIFEYSDFECPYCKKFYPSADRVVKEFAGKVNWVYRHFPGLHQPLSIVEAYAAECAGDLGGDDIFFKYHDEIYERTESNGRSLTKESGRGLDITELAKIATELNLDLDEFNKCSASMKFESKVNENMQSGAQIGVTGTPNAFIVNNKTGKTIKVKEALLYEILKEKIESAK